jgi:hypothetical protein
MKKLLISVLFPTMLLVPFVASALYNDVTLTTATVISIGGVNLNVSGSSAVIESITVNASSFSFVLLSGSSIDVTSASGQKLSTSASSKYTSGGSCSGSTYTLSHSSEVDTVTVTVSLDDTFCVSSETTTSTPGGGHRSGGGGGGATLPITPATPNPALPALTVAAPQASFNRGLSVGSTGDDVRNLQNRLLGEGLFKGEATGYFGPLTQAAVKAYQAKYGIDQLGIVGPATRAQLNKLVTANEGSNAAATTQLTSAQVVAIMSQISALLQQVQELQAKLKALGN